MPADPAAPFLCRVLPEWIDFNGHMNVAYYVLAFDKATDQLFDRLGIGDAYRRATGYSMFMLEAHVTYERELKEGDPLSIETRLIDADAKRLHFFHRMYHAEQGYLAATNELLAVHVDTTGPRSAPFPAQVAAAIESMLAEHRQLPRPPQVGRRIALGNKRAQ